VRTAITTSSSAAVAGTLAQAVDGALDLARAADLHAGQRVGHRHARGRCGSARDQIASSALGMRSRRVRMNSPYSSGMA
jgi:hypothetical protein